MSKSKFSFSESCKKTSSQADIKAVTSTHDLHKCYQEAVQNPRKEIINLQQIYHDVKSPQAPLLRLLREDFCGTAILCGEWVRRHVDNRAIGVDLDGAVLEYGSNQFKDASIKDRVELIHGDVLTVQNGNIESADLLAALNYGVCYFHTYSLLLKYFTKCFEAIKPGGVMVCDGFGGTRSTFTPWEFRRRCSHFDYIFEQSPINILTNRTTCSINFKFRDEQGHGKKLRAFVYDFRAWSVAEISEAMREAGFEDVSVWVGESQMMSDDCLVEADDSNDDLQDQNSDAFIKLDGKKLFQPKAEFWNVYVAARRPFKE